MVANGVTIGVPETWVNACYWLRTWKQMYSFKVNPVSGRQYWPKSVNNITLIPPEHHTQVGRPAKKRKRSAIEVEEMVKKGKLSRAGKTVRCLLCKELGHNRRSCKGQKLADDKKSKATTSTGTQGNKKSKATTSNGGQGNKKSKATPTPASAQQGNKKAKPSSKPAPKSSQERPLKGIVIRDAPVTRSSQPISSTKGGNVKVTGKGKAKQV